MIPKIGDKIKWRLHLHGDKRDHFNKVVDVKKCEFSHWFSTFWEVYLDNGKWIREQDVIEIITND